MPAPDDLPALFLLRSVRQTSYSDLEQGTADRTRNRRCLVPHAKSSPPLLREKLPPPCRHGPPRSRKRTGPCAPPPAYSTVHAAAARCSRHRLHFVICRLSRTAPSAPRERRPTPLLPIPNHPPPPFLPARFGCSIPPSCVRSPQTSCRLLRQGAGKRTPEPAKSPPCPGRPQQNRGACRDSNWLCRYASWIPNSFDTPPQARAPEKHKDHE